MTILWARSNVLRNKELKAERLNEQRYGYDISRLMKIVRGLLIIES